MTEARKQPLDQVVAPHIGRSVSLEEAAFMMRVTRRTIYNRIQFGRYTGVRTPDGSLRVLLQSMLEPGPATQWRRPTAPTANLVVPHRLLSF